MPWMGNIFKRAAGEPGLSFREFVAGPPKEPQGIQAFHGSPYSFDKFEWTPERASTGEGTQAFGYGLYFAQNETVARTYKAAGFRDADGKPWQSDNSAKSWAARMVAEQDGDVARARERMQVWVDLFAGNAKKWRDKSAKDQLVKAQEAAAALDSGDFPRITRPQGHMYETRLQADPETELLDLDAPLSKQHQSIQDAVARIWVIAEPGEPARFSPYASRVYADQLAELDPNTTGREILDMLGNGPEASEYLMKEGIKGVRFFDRRSREQKDGTRNYVVFDARHVELIRRYGLPIAITGGIAGGLFFPDNAEAGVFPKGLHAEAPFGKATPTIHGELPAPATGTPKQPFELPRGFKTGRALSTESGAREFEPRDLILAHNDGMPDLDLGIELGVDPEKTVSVSKLVAALKNRTREVVKQAKAENRLDDLARQWNVTPDELDQFLVPRDVGQKGKAEQRLTKAVEMIEAANRKGETIGMADLADRMAAAGYPTTVGSLKSTFSVARKGGGANMSFSPELVARVNALKMASKGTRSYTQLGAGFLAMGLAANMFSGGEAEAQGSGKLRAAAEGVRGAMPGPDGEPPADIALPRSIRRGQWLDPGPGVAFRLTPEARTELEAARTKEDTAEGPSLQNTIMAAFRRESPVVSMFVDQRVNDREGRAAIAAGEAKAFNPFEGDFLEGYAPVADRFVDVMTRREADAMKRQIDREQADMQTLALSGAPGIAAQFVAGMVDPTIFLPIAPLRRGESLLRMTWKGAVAGAGSTALSEAWLNSTQELRTGEENVMAVTGGTFFGGILGAGAHAFLKEKPKAAATIEDELTYKGADDPQFAADRADREAMRSGKFASAAGAAATEKTTIEAEALADVFGLDKVSGAVGLNPIVRLAQSESAAAREVSNNLAENGMFLGRNSKGEASPIAVETAMAEYRGWEAKAVTAGRDAYKAHRKAGGSMTRTQFYDAVGRAMRRGDEHPDPQVQKAAAAYRETVEKTKERAIEMGLLPEDIAPETAASYFHRLWNRKAMTSKPEAFQAMAADWLEETFARMQQRAFGLEADLVAEQGQQAAAKQGRTEASKALTEARNAVKVRERRLEAAKRLEAGASRRSIDAAVEWRQVKSGMKPRPAPVKIDPADLSVSKAERDALRQEWDAFDEEAVARLQKLEQDQEAFNRAGHRARLRIEQLQEELGWHRPILEKAEKDFEAAKRDHEGVKGESKLSDEDRKFVEEVKALMELERVEGSLKGVAANIAKDVYRRLIGYDQRTLPPRITIMERGPLANRTFHIPDLYQGKRPGLEASVEDFLIDDVEAVMSRYMRVMSADIELSRAFGDPTMKKAFDEINADYDELLTAAEEDLVKVAREPVERKKGESDDAYDMRIQKETERVAAAQAKLDKKWADNPEGLVKAIEKAKREIEVRRKKDLKDIAGVRDILRGNYGSPTKHDDLFVRGGAFVRNWNYVTLLGGMTVSAFPDVANKVLSNGFLGIARDLMKPLITDLKGIKIAATEARNYGVAIEGALNARIASMADIGDAYGRNTPFERSVSNVTNFFSTWTGMRLWNDVMKTADYVMAQNRAIRTLMNDKPSQRDLRWLAWAGVSHRGDMANAMRKEIEAVGDVDRGMRLANVDAWEDQAAARAFKAIMAKEASTVTVTPGAGDKMLAMHGELGKTIGQFKTFAFAAHQRVTIRALQQLRAGDAAYGSFFATATSMGMLVYWLKMSDSLRETSDDPATWVREGIDRSGMLPLLFEVYNTTEKVLQVNDKHWAKPFFPGAAASRYNSRGPIASLLGPTAGRIEDVAGVLAGFGDGQVRDSDIHALRKLLPFQNLVGIRRLLDLLEIEIDKSPAIKRTAFSKGREKILAQ